MPLQKKKTFEQLNIESWNSQFTNIFGKKLIWPNFRSSGRRNPKWLPHNETFELLNIESCNSQFRKKFVRQLFWQILGTTSARIPKMAPGWSSLVY